MQSIYKTGCHNYVCFLETIFLLSPNHMAVVAVGYFPVSQKPNPISDCHKLSKDHQLLLLSSPLFLRGTWNWCFCFCFHFCFYLSLSLTLLASDIRSGTLLIVNIDCIEFSEPSIGFLCPRLSTYEHFS